MPCPVLSYIVKSTTGDRIPGTNCTESAVSCVGFRERMVLAVTHCMCVNGWHWSGGLIIWIFGIVLRAPYAMSGTDIAYAAHIGIVLRSLTTRCPVLTSPMLLRGRYAMSGTDMRSS
eukprot:1864486-Rhodomonas_salina.1